MTVYIISHKNNSLMPTERHGKVRRLLEQGLAKVVKRIPFTIKLLYPTTEYTQKVIVGIDTGAERVSIAARANNKVVYLKEKILRTDIKFYMDYRREKRRQRRYKLRYRKARFLNRPKIKCGICGKNTPKSSKKSGGRARLCRLHENYKNTKEHSVIILPPSIKSKAEAIVNEVNRLSKILPISEIVVEVASFDTQKMANPSIQGIEYQQGTLQGYEIKQYLLTCYGHKCVYCKGKSGDNILEIDHVVPKSRGGTDRVSNLVIACRTCNALKSNRTAEEFGYPKVQKQAERHKSFRYSALSQSYKNYLIRELSKRWAVKKTYGAYTKFYRNQLGLEKTQINDAIAIVSQGNSLELPKKYIFERQLKKRQPVHKLYDENKRGRSVIKRTARRSVKGFMVWDKVRGYSKKGIVIGYITNLRNNGYFALKEIDGSKIVDSISFKNLVLLKRNKGNYVQELRNVLYEQSSLDIVPKTEGIESGSKGRFIVTKSNNIEIKEQKVTKKDATLHQTKLTDFKR